MGAVIRRGGWLRGRWRVPWVFDRYLVALGFAVGRPGRADVSSVDRVHSAAGLLVLSASTMVLMLMMMAMVRWFRTGLPSPLRCVWGGSIRGRITGRDTTA